MLLAPIKLNDTIICWGLIDSDHIFFFDKNGEKITRESLDLEDVFLIQFIKTEEERYYHIASETSVVENVESFIINNNDNVIYTSENVLSYLRLDGSSIIVNYSKEQKDATYFIPKKYDAQVVIQNQLSMYEFYGELSNRYILYSPENESFHIYEIDIEKEPVYGNEYGVDEFGHYGPLVDHYEVVSRRFAHSFSEKNVFMICNIGFGTFILSWSDKTNILRVTDYSFYDNFSKSFNLNCDLSQILIRQDKIQILSNKDYLVIHNPRGRDFNGFTLILSYYRFDDFPIKATNEKLLSDGDYYDERIDKFENSLILIGRTLYNCNGCTVAKINDDYYQTSQPPVLDYFVFCEKFEHLKLRTNLREKWYRYGLIDANNLQLLLPPSFSKIEYIILRMKDDAKKHYLEENKYKVYIKPYLELVRDDESYFICGLFRGGKEILPIAYNRIESISFEGTSWQIDQPILFEKDGLIGIFYMDAIIAPCSYVSYEIIGKNLIVLKKADDLYDVLFIYGTRSNLVSDFTEIQKASIDLQSGTFVSDNDLIVKRNSKYGIINNGELVTEVEFDEIKPINAKPNCLCGASNIPSYREIWLLVSKNDLFGVWTNSPRSPYYSLEVKYKSVDVIDWIKDKRTSFKNSAKEVIVKLDEQYYPTNSCSDPFVNSSDFSFCGFIAYNIVAFYNPNNDELLLFYVNGKTVEFDIEEDDDLGKYAIHSEYAEYVFSFESHSLIPNPFFEDDDEEEEIEEDYGDYSSYEDDNDYERDTYYALGGDDYDAFKERGGSIDVMMEGMGF